MVGVGYGGRNRVGVKFSGQKIWPKIGSRGRGHQERMDGSRHPPPPTTTCTHTLRRGSLKPAFEIICLVRSLLSDHLAVFLSIQKEVCKP